MANIKLKKILKEDFTRTLAGGIVTMKPSNQISLSNIVKEKYGDANEEKVDIEGLTTEISSYNELGESIFVGDLSITPVNVGLPFDTVPFTSSIAIIFYLPNNKLVLVFFYILYQLNEFYFFLLV